MRLITANIQIQSFKLDEGLSVPDFVPKARIDLGVAAEQADQVTAAIQDTARTGQVDDGKLLAPPIERAVRIRTGETDKAAVQAFTDIFLRRGGRQWDSGHTLAND
jgi:nitrogen regulatory protein PII